MENLIASLALMPEEERFYYLATHCVYLLSRETESTRISLFACENFYLEVSYDKNGDGITDMEVFINEGKIESYLKDIELGNIES
jgi:hypothetical protein